MEAEIRALRKQLGEKDEVIDILKKSVGILSKPIVEKYRCVQGVTAPGNHCGAGMPCFGWQHRTLRMREQRNQSLQRRLVELHQKYPALDLDSHHMLTPEFGCSRKRVHRQMRVAGSVSARRRAYKAITNSQHGHPPAPNILHRKFYFKHLSQT